MGTTYERRGFPLRLVLKTKFFVSTREKSAHNINEDDVVGGESKLCNKLLIIHHCWKWWRSNYVDGKVSASCTVLNFVNPSQQQLLEAKFTVFQSNP